MKTMKLAMVAMLIAFTSVCFASGDEFRSKPKEVVKITLEKALYFPELVAAMQEQLTPEFLGNVQAVYTADIIYEDVIWRISGTLEEWEQFFHLEPKVKPEKEPVSSN